MVEHEGVLTPRESNVCWWNEHPVADMESFQKSHGLDHEALKKIYKQFLAIDQDKSGMVDINEFCRLLRVERSPFVERLFGMFDTDKTGTIDLKEFVVGLSNVGTAAREDKVKFAFQVFDLDGSGTIEADELKKIVKATNMSEEAVKSNPAGMASKSGLGFILSCFSPALAVPGDMGAEFGFAATLRACIHFFIP